MPEGMGLGLGNLPPWGRMFQNQGSFSFNGPWRGAMPSLTPRPPMPTMGAPASTHPKADAAGVQQAMQKVGAGSFGWLRNLLGAPSGSGHVPPAPGVPGQRTLGLGKAGYDLKTGFEKLASQDNRAPQRSETGGSTGLKYQHKADDYAQGLAAWQATGMYFRGGKKLKSQPNPFTGKHRGKEKQAGVGDWLKRLFFKPSGPANSLLQGPLAEMVERIGKQRGIPMPKPRNLVRPSLMQGPLAEMLDRVGQERGIPLAKPRSVIRLPQEPPGSLMNMELPKAAGDDFWCKPCKCPRRKCGCPMPEKQASVLVPKQGVLMAGRQGQQQGLRQSLLFKIRQLQAQQQAQQAQQAKSMQADVSMLDKTAGISHKLMGRFAPLTGRRQHLEPFEEEGVRRGERNPWPDLFDLDSEPVYDTLRSPASRGVAGGLAGAAAGGAAGYGLGGLKGALAGATMGGVGTGVYSYLKRRKQNEHIKETMRRLPPGATKRDYEFADELGRLFERQLSKSGFDKQAISTELGGAPSRLTANTLGQLGGILSLNPVFSARSHRNPDEEAHSDLATAMGKGAPEELSTTKLRLGGTDVVDDLLWKRMGEGEQAPWHQRLGGRLLHNPRTGPLGKLLGAATYPISWAQSNLGRSPHYNPHTDVAHNYWDSPAATSHELGHAIDFNQFPLHKDKGAMGTLKRLWQGTKRDVYGLGRSLPFYDLVQEIRANLRSGEALKKGLKRKPEDLYEVQHDRAKLLPAGIGSYIGGGVGKAVSAIPGGQPLAMPITLGGIVGGKMYGEHEASKFKEEYDKKAKKPSRKKEKKAMDGQDYATKALDRLRSQWEKEAGVFSWLGQQAGNVADAGFNLYNKAATGVSNLGTGARNLASRASTGVSNLYGRAGTGIYNAGVGVSNALQGALGQKQTGQYQDFKPQQAKQVAYRQAPAASNYAQQWGQQGQVKDNMIAGTAGGMVDRGLGIANRAMTGLHNLGQDISTGVSNAGTWGKNLYNRAATGVDNLYGQAGTGIYNAGVGASNMLQGALGQKQTGQYAEYTPQQARQQAYQRPQYQAAQPTGNQYAQSWGGPSFARPGLSPRIASGMGAKGQPQTRQAAPALGMGQASPKTAQAGSPGVPGGQAASGPPAQPGGGFSQNPAIWAQKSQPGGASPMSQQPAMAAGGPQAAGRGPRGLAGPVGGPAAPGPAGSPNGPPGSFNKASAYLTPFTKGFLARCLAKGLTDEQVKQAADLAAEQFPEAREELVKLAAGWGRAFEGGMRRAGQATRQGMNAYKRFSKGPMGQAIGPGAMAQTALGGFFGGMTGEDLAGEYGKTPGMLMGAAMANPYARKAMAGKMGQKNFTRYLANPWESTWKGSVAGSAADQLTHWTGLQDQDSNMFGRMGAWGGLGSGALRGMHQGGVFGQAGKQPGMLNTMLNANTKLNQGMGNFARGNLSGMFAPFTGGMNYARKGLAGTRMGQALGVTAPQAAKYAPGMMGRAGKLMGAAGATAGIGGMGMGMANNWIEDQKSQMVDRAMQHPAIQRRLQQADQMLGQGRNMMGGFNQLVGMGDPIFQALGMNPQQMSPMQKMMLLGGGASMLGGLGTGSQGMTGLGGLMLAGGMMGGFGGQGQGQQQPSPQQATSPWIAPAGGQMPHQAPQPRNELAYQQQQQAGQRTSWLKPWTWGRGQQASPGSGADPGQASMPAGVMAD